MPIYLVRHGETPWSLTGQHTGRTEVPLTERGEEEARGLRARLDGVHFDRVLSSPRQRALTTARLCGVEPAAEVCQDLAEFDYGDYEGLTSEQIDERKPDWNLWRDGCPGGESPEEVLIRAKSVLLRLDPRPDRDYALFGHGHMLRAVATAYLGLPIGFCRHLTLKVASISVLGLEHGTPSIDAWDIT